MKNILPFLFLVLSFTACENKSPENTNATAVDTVSTTPPAVVGNDADEHGCKASAGYTWSVVKNECIRIWETGVQLKQIDTTGSSTSVASVVLSADKKVAELFVADEKGGVQLASSSDKNDSYKAGDYELSMVDKKWLLKKAGKAIYQE